MANSAIVVTEGGKPARRRHAARHHLVPLRADDGNMSMDFATRAIHAGQDADPTTGATIVPIYETSTYTQTAVGEHKGFDYSRVANPTRNALEDAARRARRRAVLRRVRVGARRGERDHRPALGRRPRRRQRRHLRRHVPAVHPRARALRPDVHVRRHDRSRRGARGDPAEHEDVLDRDADQPDAAHRSTSRRWPRSRRAGQLVVVDNTFCTPYFQSPLALGADVVVHSTTKYIGGHSDVIGGAAMTERRRDRREPALLAEDARRDARARSTRF